MDSMVKSIFILLVATSLSLAKDPSPKDKPATKAEPAKKAERPQTLSRGWADSHEWVQTYEEALYKAKSGNKPLMVINHRDDCEHSQALKKAFAEHKGIQKLAEEFVLLNVIEFEDKCSQTFCNHSSQIRIALSFFLITTMTAGPLSRQYDPTDKNLLLDGQYVPKLLFVALHWRQMKGPIAAALSAVRQAPHALRVLI